MNKFLKYITIFFVVGYTLFAFMDRGAWSFVPGTRSLKQKNKFWQVHLMHKGRPLIYVIESRTPTVRIFHGPGAFHHPLGLEAHGLGTVSDVALCNPVSDAGQAMFMGDRRQKRIFYLILGKRYIREMPLHPETPSAYSDFLAALHPVPESIRHN